MFDGWHPQCFCFVTPILIDVDEMKKMNEAMLRGETYTPRGKRITEFPENFKQWVRENQNKILASHEAGKAPYFVRNNFGAVQDILNPKKKLTSLQIAKQRHDARTPEQEEAIRLRWKERKQNNSVNVFEVANNAIENKTIPFDILLRSDKKPVLSGIVLGDDVSGKGVTFLRVPEIEQRFTETAPVLGRSKIKYVEESILYNNRLANFHREAANSYIDFIKKCNGEDLKEQMVVRAKKHLELAKKCASARAFIVEKFGDYSMRRKDIKLTSRVTIANKELFAPMIDKSVTISQKGIKEWLNQPHKHYIEKNEILGEIDIWLGTSKYCGWMQDKHDPIVKAHIFEVTINNDKSWILVREMQDGEFRLYSILDALPKK